MWEAFMNEHLQSLSYCKHLNQARNFSVHWAYAPQVGIQILGYCEFDGKGIGKQYLPDPTDEQKLPQTHYSLVNRVTFF